MGVDGKAVFRRRDVVCPAPALESCLWPLRWQAELRLSAGECAILDAAPLDVGANALHRYLLAAKRTAGWRLREAIERALRRVRPHSTLYTARHCDCLVAAEAAFADTVQALLPAGTVFAVRVARHPQLTDGADWVGPLEAWPVLRRFATDGRRLVGEVTVTAEPGTLSISAGRGADTRAYVLVPVPDPVRQELRYRVARGCPMHSRHGNAAAIVLSWPASWLALVDALHAVPSLTPQGCPLDWSRQWTGAGMAGLDVAGLEVATRLAVAWPGSLPDLLATAAAVLAAPAHAR